MFEKQVKTAFKIASLNKEEAKIFYILTHKKHKREIYFEKDNPQAIKFIKIKMSSFKKRVIYILLKLKILNLFLKKIRLPVGVGQVVFVGGQIKIFNFNKEEVISFPLDNSEKKNFLKFKEYQKVMGEENFSPKIIEINSGKYFSREELISPLIKFSSKRVFEKIIEYYGTTFQKVVNSLDYLNFLKIELDKKMIKDRFIQEVFDLLKKKEIDIIVLKIHGDFAKGQILKKRDLFLFTDWSPYEDVIVGDLTNFFREIRDLLSDKEVIDIIKLYPKEVRDNISYYLILSEIKHICLHPDYLNYGKTRIKNLIKSFS